jgi:hypothetical protein
VTNSALAPEPTNITEKLEDAGWSKDHPDAYRLVDNSPALECARYGGNLYKYGQQSKPQCIKIPFYLTENTAQSVTVGFCL